MAERSDCFDGGESKQHGNGDCKSLRDIRKAHIERILALSGGDVDEAAIILQIPAADLRRWMKKLGIK